MDIWIVGRCDVQGFQRIAAAPTKPPTTTDNESAMGALLSARVLQAMSVEAFAVGSACWGGGGHEISMCVVYTRLSF